MSRARLRIISFTIIVEGFLFAVTALWANFRELPLLPPLALSDVWWGLAAVLPLQIFNFLLFFKAADRFQVLEKCRLFRDEILLPLARELDLFSAILVSICAGIGEELFFRYLLQTEFGLIIASCLFAFLHFGPVIRHYWLIAGIYLLFGFYFGIVFEVTQSVWAVIFAHAVYDLLALTYLRRMSIRQSDAAHTVKTSSELHP